MQSQLLKKTKEMLKYLIIQLCDCAPSFCHYHQGVCKGLISKERLEQGIIWSMKQNVSVQIVYPSYVVPQEYKDLISRIDSVAIIPSDCEDKNLLDNAEVIVIESIEKLLICSMRNNVSYVLRTTFGLFLHRYQEVVPVLAKVSRLNVVITDIETITEDQLEDYKTVLGDMAEFVKKEYLQGHLVQCNLLTDRFMLSEMNNCNAGCDTVTLAPDGNFYVCPAFYFEQGNYGLGRGKFDIGTLSSGLCIKNAQLYELDYAPLCRMCDAYQCKRCVWLNRKMTYEVNTPSHEQCVMAHIERNASRLLLRQIQEKGTFIPDKEIMEINYLDPFDFKPTR